MLRTILSIIVGYVTMVVLTLVFFAVLGAISPDAFSNPYAFPDTPYVVAILVACFLFAICGGYVAVWVGKWSAATPSLWFAALIVIMGAISATYSPAPQPLWYQLALPLLGVSGMLLGGKLRLCAHKAEMSH